MLIRCLGPVALQHVNGETRLPAARRHILALLVAAGTKGVTADRLADEMYGEELTPGWEAAVRKNISRLRPALEVHEIVNRNGRYSLNVPADQVDLWTLLAIDHLDIAAISEDLIQDLLSGEPFAGVEPSPLLIETVESIAIARLQLVQKMCAGDTSHWSAKTLHAARTLAALSYYREDFLLAVLELHRAGAHGNSALEFAAKAHHFLLEEMGQGLGTKVQALIDAISDQLVEDSGAALAIEQMSGRVLGRFEPAVAASMIDRDDLHNAIQIHMSGPGVLVTGDSGSGKSALMQSFVPHLAKQGRHVLWLTGRRGSTSAYQPFLAAVPSLEQHLAPLLADGGNELLRARCWAAARRRLATEFIDLPFTLIVDDAQWLDSHSQSLAIFLASRQDPAAPTLIVIGRDDPSARNWGELSNDLVGLGLATVTVSAFGQDQLVELIGLHHPAATSKQRLDFATTLIRRRAALPAVAHELVRSADPNTLTITELRLGGDGSGVWTSRVRPQTQRIAAIAAILGMRFRLAAIAELSGLAVDSIADASDELRDADVWVAEQRPDEFSFRHVLIHADFDGVLLTGERRRLHLQAGEATQSRGDIHASATHFVEAGALVGNDHVVLALLVSARQFQSQGSYREAVEAFSHARQIADHELSIDDLLGFASAVSSSGGDGWNLRTAAFELALASGDGNQGLDVALYGALRTEDAMGQPRRVDMLERIDNARLSHARRAEHAQALAREFGLLGLHDRAIETATSAMSQASTADDRFVAWLGAWPSCRSLPPDSWPELPHDRGAVSRPGLVSRLAQVECGLALVTGNDAVARRRLRDFADHPATRSDPLRTWHAALVGTTLAFVDGRWADSRQQATEAFTSASDQGVIAAFSTRVAQEFALQWVVGQHGALLSQFENAPPDVHNSLLARAAFAITLAEHDAHQDRAKAMIAEVASQAHDHKSPLSPAASVLLASAPAGLLTNEITQTLREILKPFRGSAVVPGAALCHLGPASLSLARLAHDHDESVELISQAVDETERWNLRLWSIICLRDLAALTNNQELAEDAYNRAAGTQLEMLL